MLGSSCYTIAYIMTYNGWDAHTHIETHKIIMIADTMAGYWAILLLCVTHMSYDA